MTRKQSERPKRIKRANGSGTVHQMPNGRWRWQSPPVGAEGKRVSRTYRKKTEADAAQAKGMTQHREGELSVPTKRTLKEQLDLWFDHQHAGWAANTSANYRRIIHVHLVPSIGHVRIQALTAEDVLKAYKAIRDAKTSRGHSATLLRTARTALNGSLDMAVKLGHLQKSPAAGVKLITQRVGEKRITPHWDMRSASIFLKQVPDTHWGNVLKFILLTGLRRGEVLGLRWKSVRLDEKNPSIHIVDNWTRADGECVLTTLKSLGSRRTLPIGGPALALLRQLKTRQTDQTSEFVFTSEAGTPLGPDNADRALAVLCKQLSLPIISPHGLRHTYVSVQRKQGVSIERISKQIGHANFSVTLSVYSHIFQEDLTDLTLDASSFETDWE